MADKIKYTLEIDDDGFVKVVKQATDGVEGLDKAVEKTSKNSSTNLTSMTTKMADLTLAINGTIQIAKGLVNTFSDMANVAKRVVDSQTGLTKEQRDYSIEMEKTTGLHKTEVNILQQKANAYNIQKDRQKEMIRDAITLGKETGNYADILKKMAESASSGDYGMLKEILPTIQGGKENAITDAIKWTEYLNQKKIELDASMSNNSGIEEFNNAMTSLKEVVSSSLTKTLIPLLQSITPIIDVLGNHTTLILSSIAGVMTSLVIPSFIKGAIGIKSFIGVIAGGGLNYLKMLHTSLNATSAAIDLYTTRIRLAGRTGTAAIRDITVAQDAYIAASIKSAAATKAFNSSMKALFVTNAPMLAILAVVSAVAHFVEVAKTKRTILESLTAQNQAYKDSIEQLRESVKGMAKDELEAYTKTAKTKISYMTDIINTQLRIIKEEEARRDEQAKNGEMRDSKSAKRLEQANLDFKRWSQYRADIQSTLGIAEASLTTKINQTKTEADLNYDKLKRDSIHRLSQLNKEAMEKELDEAKFRSSEAVRLIQQQVKEEKLTQEQANSLIALETEANAKIINDIKVKYHDIDKANQEKYNRELADANIAVLKKKQELAHSQLAIQEQYNRDAMKLEEEKLASSDAINKEMEDMLVASTKTKTDDLILAYNRDVNAYKDMLAKEKITQQEFDAWMNLRNKQFEEDSITSYKEIAQQVGDILKDAFKDLFVFDNEAWEEQKQALQEQREQSDLDYQDRIEKINAELQVESSTAEERRALLREKAKLEKDYAKEKAKLAKQEEEQDALKNDRFKEMTKNAIKASIDMLAAKGAAAAFAQVMMTVPFPANIVLAPLAYAGAYTAISAAKMLFRKGGYTGDGNPDDEAGIVHKKEFVATAETTERVGIPALEALQDGKATIVPITPVSKPDAYTGSVNTGYVANAVQALSMNLVGSDNSNSRETVIINNSDLVTITKKIEQIKSENKNMSTNKTTRSYR